MSGEEKVEGPKALSIKRNMLFNTIGSLMYQGCLWLTTVVVVTLSSDYNNSGILALAMTVGNMLVPIATYTIRTYQVSDVGETYSKANYVTFRLITILVGLALLVPYTLLIGTSAEVIVAILLYLLFKVDESFCDVLYGIDQSRGRMDFIGISQFVRGVLVIVLFGVGLRAFDSLWVAIAGMMAAGLATTLLYDLPHARLLGLHGLGITGGQVRSLFVTCLPAVLSSLLVSMVVSVSRQYFSSVFGTEQLGYYAAVATPTVLIQAAARYLYSPLLVPLADRWNASSVAEFRHWFWGILVRMLGAILVIVVVLSVAGAPLLRLVYGPSIDAYTYLFPPTLVCATLIALIWFFSDVLVIMRDMSGELIANAATFAVSMVLMVPLINAFYMNGLNMVIIASMLVGIAVCAIRLLRLFRRREAVRP